MNNFYALIYLTREIKTNLSGNRFISSYTPHKDVWEGFFESDDGNPARLVFSARQGETALFLDRYRPPKKSQVLHFFEPLAGHRVIDVKLAEGDRFIHFEMSDGTTLQFQLFGHDANIFRVQNRQVRESFRDPQRWKGEPPPEPRAPARGDLPDLHPGARKLILTLDPAFPRSVLDRVIDHYDLEKAEMETVRETVNKLQKAMIEQPEFRLLENGRLTLLPEKLLPGGTRQTFDSVNEAIRTAYREASHRRRFSRRKKQWETKISKAIQRTERSLGQLEESHKALERADGHETTGHILMAHAHLKPDPGRTRLELTDIYQPDRTVEVDVKPELSIAENARRYYNKAAGARRRVSENRRRESELGKNLGELKKMEKELEATDHLPDLYEWEKKNRDRLQSEGWLKKNQTGRSHPWKTLQLEDYEVWVGRNARSNDAVTTSAHKEDLWLHARGTGGSHVVIRMDNRKEDPPPRVVQRAASWAAWHSGLRGSDLVPVVITRRKYVTKPKGAPAGSVRVNREEVKMVTPRKPEL